MNMLLIMTGFLLPMGISALTESGNKPIEKLAPYLGKPSFGF